MRDSEVHIVTSYSDTESLLVLIVMIMIDGSDALGAHKNSIQCSLWSVQTALTSPMNIKYVVDKSSHVTLQDGN